MPKLHIEPLEKRIALSTYYLHQGDNLQKAIWIANPGDTIYLDAGAVFTGPITLLAKPNPNHQWITIATNNFPLAHGVRVDPTDAPMMAKIVSPGDYKMAVQTLPGANFYDLRGLEILPINAAAIVDTLVLIGTAAETRVAGLPNNIVIDQCFIHGWNGQDIKRGVALNDGAPGSQTGVYNSYLSNFKSTDYDSQAIAGWNGTGPYTIENNYLEAAGENVLFGGAYSYTQQVPSNITIVNNLFDKRLTWDPYDPSYAGVPWSVKNLLELKNAENVLIQGNVFQHNWVRSQDGHAILFTPRGSQSGGSWVTVRDIVFTQNVINHVAQVFNLLGSDDSSKSRILTNVSITDNLIGADIGTSEWGGTSGQFAEILPGENGGATNVTIDHNTIIGGSTVILVSGTVKDFSFTNNIVFESEYGILVSGYGEGTKALAIAFPGGYVITNNVIIGDSAGEWPSGNSYAPSKSAVGFVDYADGNYTLDPDSPYHDSATDGTDPGADIVHGN